MSYPYSMTTANNIVYKPVTDTNYNHDSISKYFKDLVDRELCSTYFINSVGLTFKPNKVNVPQIKNIIFNNPYTIVFWQDGTKTTVTCGKDDVWDEEKGIALAFVKKIYGNKGSYINNIKPFLSENVEKEKVKAALAKAKYETELKADEEKRRQRHIKNLAKKQLRKEKLEREIKSVIKELKLKENGSLADAFSRAAKSASQCGMAMSNAVENVTNTYNSGDVHIHCDTKDKDIAKEISKIIGNELNRANPNANS